MECRECLDCHEFSKTYGLILMCFFIRLKHLYKTANLTYVLPLHRATPYVFGVSLGVLLFHTGKNVKIHKVMTDEQFNRVNCNKLIFNNRCSSFWVGYSPHRWVCGRYFHLGEWPEEIMCTTLKMRSSTQ